MSEIDKVNDENKGHCLINQFYVINFVAIKID